MKNDKITEKYFITLNEINRKIICPRSTIKFSYLTKIKSLIAEDYNKFSIGKTYGKFNNLRFSLSDEDKDFMHQLNIDNVDTLMNYVFSENEFEAWVANAVEDFEHYEYWLTIDIFEKIIKNKELFTKYFIDWRESNFGELILFAELCYMLFKNNDMDDTYWYLINAIKEN